MLIPYVEQIHLGVFIPNRKLHTQPMKQLEKYLKSKGYTLYYFEDAYREEISVENWPHVDIMITFFSEGIDFLKVREYAQMHRPIEINKIDKQFLLLDRRAVMAVLDKIEVPTAKRIIYNGRGREKETSNILNDLTVSSQERGKRDAPSEYDSIVNTSSIMDVVVKDGVFDASPEISRRAAEEDKESVYSDAACSERSFTSKKSAEAEIDRIVKVELQRFSISRESLFKPSKTRVCSGDTLQIGNEAIDKPYVEKPAYSEDHNINIYYSQNCKERRQGICRLFRKIGSKSSNYDKNSGKISYREDGSFIYEKFIEVKGYLDIKTYVLGKTVYAETRKSPVKDGIVIRTESGKEERKEIQLSKEEINAVQSISKSFGQFICGMDILRDADGGFIVVDVNGWSFVKSNLKYYTQKNLKYLDKKIKKEVLRSRAKQGDSTRRRDVSLYKELAELIIKDAQKDGKYKEKEEQKTDTNEVDMRKIEVKGIHSVYRHARRTPKLKKRLVFVSELLIEYIGRACNMAGRDTSKVKEIEELLDRENREREAFRTPENLLALSSLKEIAQMNTSVRVKLQQEESSVKLILKWGGLLTKKSKQEIEYEAMEYESFVSTIQGDSFSPYDLYSPTKPTSNLRTEKKIRIFANPEDRTQKTAEVFRSVFKWTGRTDAPIKEKYFSILREAEPIPDKLCSDLACAYMMLKESFLYQDSSKRLSIEPVLIFDKEHICNDSTAERNVICMNKISIKKQPVEEESSDLCLCKNHSPCECKETDFLKRWCFAFNEYPFLTHKNAKTVIPMLLDFINYDILSCQYEHTISPVFRYFKNVLELYLLLNAHACFLYRNRIETFFKTNEKLDIIKYMYSRFGSHSDTVYITKKFTILLLLQYILSIKDTIYIDEELKSRIKSTMHGIGFLSSIVMVHLCCQETEYILVKYSPGIHIDNRITESKKDNTHGKGAAMEQILRADRKKVLCIVRKSVFFHGYI
ncbi:inositol-hexakisphosphate/diphosphoinositol-pentakisphosphate 1-kinase [Nematocida ausubeli]|nr:inositol-hexakisphosphate/diphosphoinositol-pentakisphosphate 1-kinase [Nematocida ausubeli]